MDWLLFLGRLHVLALHLPIGIITVLVVLEFLARRPKYAQLSSASSLLWAAACVSTIITVALGLMHATEGGFVGQSFVLHRAFGILVALATTGLWLFRTLALQAFQRTQAVTGPLLLVLLTLTGHYGGNMTHGSSFLVEYAPQPIRALAGLQPRRQVASLAQADVWSDVVQPLLELRCGSCHWEEDQKGQLSFATYADTMLGGENYPAAVPGNLQESEMYYRITLPQDSEEFMPDEGNTPLTPGQVAIIGWWIEQGAPGEGSVEALPLSEDIATLIAAELGL